MRLANSFFVMISSLLYPRAGAPPLASTCYYPDGTPSPDHPCDPANPVSMCCGANSFCLDNGLCSDSQDDVASFYSGLFRGSCTDKSWQSDRCPQFCLNDAGQSSSASVTYCSESTFACQGGRCGGNREFYAPGGTGKYAQVPPARIFSVMSSLSSESSKSSVASESSKEASAAKTSDSTATTTADSSSTDSSSTSSPTDSPASYSSTTDNPSASSTGPSLTPNMSTITSKPATTSPVSAPTSASDSKMASISSPALSPGAIAGLVIGLILALIVLAVLGWFCAGIISSRRRRRRSKIPDDNPFGDHHRSEKTPLSSYWKPQRPAPGPPGTLIHSRDASVASMRSVPSVTDPSDHYPFPVAAIPPGPFHERQQHFPSHTAYEPGYASAGPFPDMPPPTSAPPPMAMTGDIADVHDARPPSRRRSQDLDLEDDDLEGPLPAPPPALAAYRGHRSPRGSPRGSPARSSRRYSGVSEDPSISPIEEESEEDVRRSMGYGDAQTHGRGYGSEDGGARGSGDEGGRGARSPPPMERLGSQQRWQELIGAAKGRSARGAKERGGYGELGARGAPSGQWSSGNDLAEGYQ